MLKSFGACESVSVVSSAVSSVELGDGCERENPRWDVDRLPPESEINQL